MEQLITVFYQPEIHYPWLIEVTPPPGGRQIKGMRFLYPASARAYILTWEQKGYRVKPSRAYTRLLNAPENS